MRLDGGGRGVRARGGLRGAVDVLLRVGMGARRRPVGLRVVVQRLQGDRLGSGATPTSGIAVGDDAPEVARVSTGGVGSADTSVRPEPSTGAGAAAGADEARVGRRRGRRRPRRAARSRTSVIRSLSGSTARPRLAVRDRLCADEPPPDSASEEPSPSTAGSGSSAGLLHADVACAPYRSRSYPAWS